jgi:hypothetical protein
MNKKLINFLCVAAVVSSVNPMINAKAGNVSAFKSAVVAKTNILSAAKQQSKKVIGSKNNQVPNPWVSYKTLGEARKAIGFTFAVPSVLPDGYNMKDIMVIKNDMAEVFYYKGNNSILYRVAKGNKDISGDHTVYTDKKTITVGNIKVNCKGAKGSIKLATWSKDGISYSLSFKEGINDKELAKVIQSIKADKTNKKINSSQIPCPLVNYNTIDEARKAVGFTFAVPSVMPDSYNMKDIIVISNDLAEVFYYKGDNCILYRTAKGNDDISGDYNIYTEKKTITIGNAKITCKGENGSIKLATWSNDGISYSLSFKEGIDENGLTKVIENIK